MKKSVLALCVSLLLAACADRDLMPIVPEAVNIGTPLGFVGLRNSGWWK